MQAPRRIFEPQSARLSGSQKLVRTANLPDDISITMCGWARLSVDTNTFAVLAGIQSSTTQLVQLATDSDGTTLKIFTEASTAGTVKALTLGRDFFWAMTSSALTASANIGYYRAVFENTLTSAACSGTARAAFTPASVLIGDDNVTGSEQWNGRVWNVMCWDRVLTASELLRQSYYQYPWDYTSLNFWWPMDKGDAKDWGPNRRDATVTGTLSAEPVEIYLRNRRYAPIVPYLSSANLSLSIDTPGAVTLAGQSITAKLNTALSNGAITLAGQSVTPALTIPVTNGAITIAGQSATFGIGVAQSVQGAITLAGQSTGLSLGTSVTNGAITVAGQPITFTEGLAVSNGLITFAGQSVTLANAGNINVDIDAAGQISIAGQSIGFQLTQPSADQPSGGYSFYYDIERHRAERRKRLEEEEEREREAEEIQAKLDREIALLLREQEAKDAERADLQRIQTLADQYAGQGSKLGLPRRVSTAILKAQEERTFNSLQQMQREIERMLDEEEAHIQALLMLDDD